MRKRLAAVAILVAGVITATALVASSAFGSKNQNQILIGISAAKTGILAPYDLQAGQLFQMRMEQINKAGGVLGKQIKVEWIDTKSDKPTAATNADELIGKGAVVIIATCDFDFSFPAINAARGKNVPGLALCASSPKVATPAIVGPYGGSMGLGSDAEGVAMAEWLRKNRPQLRRAYVFKDNSLEYSKATADYFKARWTQLGGTVCGEDTFVGGPNLDLSSQITRLRGKVAGCDVLYDGSWQPYGSQLIRAIRDAGINTWIATNASVNGTLVRQVAGRVSRFITEGFVCLPTYCTGTSSPLIRTVAAQFKAKYGVAIGNHYATRGYDLANAVVAAIKKAGKTDGPSIAKALFDSGLVLNTLPGKAKFTSKCHRPQPAGYSIELWTNGKDRQIGTWNAQSIPNIGDGSPCSGKPPKVG
jgi:branched-chain amino acid transport system substrate-binding protein